MPLPALRNYPYLDIMGEMGYAFWPIPWLSPRHALVLVSLPMLALLQGLIAAALMSCLLQNTTVRAAAPAWRPLVLTTLMPSAVLFFAIRWAGLPLASAAIDQAIWPVWAGFSCALLLLGLASFSRRPLPPSWTRTLVGLGAALAMTCWSLAVAFALTPHRWLASPHFATALQPPSLAPILAYHLASTFCFLLPFSDPLRDNARALLRALTVVAASFCSVVLLTASHWLPSETVPAFSVDALERGNAALSTRWTMISTGAWLSVGIVSAFFSGTRARSAVLLGATIASIASQGTWMAYQEPWALRPQTYINGMQVMTARTQRRSPALPTDAPKRAEQVFDRQCASCHAKQGPFSLRKTARRPKPESLRQRLETLREADRPWNPYHRVMPPLVGSDEEVNALGAWISNEAN